MQLPEIPFVIADTQMNVLKKTKQAVELLQKLHAYEDIQKSINTKHIRPGKGKARGRRYIRSKGPLIIHTKSWSNSLVKSFRNIPGVELCNVKRLNLLTLAPGGHLGRFVIWTESAFKKLNIIFGTLNQDSKVKHGFRIPRPVITNADLTRIINSDEVQSALRRKNTKPKFQPRKRNPLKNLGAMIKLNPYFITQKRRTLINLQKARSKKPEDKKKKKKKTQRAGKRFLAVIRAPAIAPARDPSEVTPKFQ
jgi:large subunit ribosomal protein L4e